MRTQLTAAANPFAMMMDPQGVIEAVERSNHLGSLNRRICRPLDKPLIPKSADAKVEDYDRDIDADDSDILTDSSDIPAVSGAENPAA